jgi:hypothetical protein
LAPQDPADEPASVLLARIREAKDEGKGKHPGWQMKLPYSPMDRINKIYRIKNFT